MTKNKIWLFLFAFIIIFSLNKINTKAEEIIIPKNNQKSTINELPSGGIGEIIDHHLNSYEIENMYIKYDVPSHKGFKSYMNYTAITNKNSKQYKLQQIAETDENGFRLVEERYCVAVGSFCDMNIGQYFNLILENGIEIPCIMGDLKADIHTDNDNIFTLSNKCCSEFIIDRKMLNDKVKQSGDCSSLVESWNSPVIEIRVYNKIIDLD